ncbi:hypothetical protein DW810_17285 [Phocaeicola vulgatus]|nr:hypothetical protein DW810_17285 [Phocaeicola vulgatus]
MGHEVYFLHVIYYAFTKKNKRLTDEGIIGTKNYWRDHYFQYRTSLSSRIIEEIKKAYTKFSTIMHDVMIIILMD